MNKVILIGRLTKDVDYRSGSTDVARYTLAVDRWKEGTDFIPCVAFGKAAQFADNYFHKGMKVAIAGRIQVGSYKNKDGQTVYTTEVVIESQEFCEPKTTTAQPPVQTPDEGGYVNIPDNVDEKLPFH